MKMLNDNHPVKLFATVFAIVSLPCLTVFILVVNAVVK